jgi:TolA-binding protein
LAKRAEEIVKRAKAELARFHGEGRGHLVAELEHEITRVEQLEKELKALPHGTILELSHIHQVEEQLLQHENRLAEEVARIGAHSEEQVCSYVKTYLTHNKCK